MFFPFNAVDTIRWPTFIFYYTLNLGIVPRISSGAKYDKFIQCKTENQRAMESNKILQLNHVNGITWHTEFNFTFQCLIHLVSVNWPHLAIHHVEHLENFPFFALQSIIQWNLNHSALQNTFVLAIIKIEHFPGTSCCI